MSVRAFPSGKADETKGMELRDYFAGQALPQIIAINDRVTAGRDDVPYGAALKVTAIQAYAIADAMLAERTKGP
jgi:hypothetical protein